MPIESMVVSVSKLAWKTLRTIRSRVCPPDELASLRRRMPDANDADRHVMAGVRPYTMVGPERLYAYIQATRYVVGNEVPGAIVECGVWRGGATMASIMTLQSLDGADRDFYLYDTYEGMSRPTEHDRRRNGSSAEVDFNAKKIDDQSSHWCRAELDAVRESVLGTGYAAERIHFVKGKVEDTIPQTVPEKIAILRLDTDWYESTKHELENLFPLLSKGGVLLIDDYGHWQGAQKAVDEYFAAHQISMFLGRSDYTGRAGVKV